MEQQPQQPPPSEQPQPNYPQPGQPQPTYPQPGYPQPTYPQPGQPQPGYQQPGYPPQPQPYGPPNGAPGYPPQQPYGPPAGYPMPPASTPPGYYGPPPTGAPGYPPQQPYPQQPDMTGAPYPYPNPNPYPYQASPFPQPTLAPSTGSSRGLTWALVSLGVVVVVVLAVLGVTVFAKKGSSTPGSSTPGGSSATNSATYSAPIPGPGCDTHGGVWKADFDTQTSCLADRLHVTSPDVGSVIFSGTSATNPLPQNYEVSVDVAPFSSLDAGIVFRQTSLKQDGYEFGIDSTGAWTIYDESLTSSLNANLPSGTVAAAAQYHLDVTVKGSAVTLAINGAQVNQFSDTAYPSGDSLSLIAYAADNSAQADFKNFVFKALP